MLFDVLLFSSTSSPTPLSSLAPVQQIAATSSSAVALATVAKTTAEVSWSLAAMQAYQTLGCQTPAGASGFGSTAAFYGQSTSPYSSIPAGSYSDGVLFTCTRSSNYNSDAVIYVYIYR